MKHLHIKMYKTNLNLRTLGLIFLKIITVVHFASAQNVPGTPSLVPPNFITARCESGRVTFTVATPQTTQGDEVVLINRAIHGSYPMRDITTDMQNYYNFGNIRCTGIFNYGPKKYQKSGTTYCNTLSQWRPLNNCPCSCGPGGYCETFPHPSPFSEQSVAIYASSATWNFSGTPILLRGKPTNNNLNNDEAGSKYILVFNNNNNNNTLFYARFVVRIETPPTQSMDFGKRVWRFALGKDSDSTFKPEKQSHYISEISAGFDIKYNRSNWELTDLQGNPLTSYNGFVPNNNYSRIVEITIEVIGNNSSDELYYNYKNTIHALARGSYNIWLNGIKLHSPSLNMSPNLSLGDPINSFALININSVTEGCEISLKEVAFKNDYTLDYYATPSVQSIANSQGRSGVTTPNLTVTTTYYVAAIDKKNGMQEGTWQMNLIPLEQMVSIYPNPPAPSANAQYVCGSGTTTITVNPNLPGNYSILLYTLPSGGVPVNTDNDAPYSLNTPFISTQTAFYVEAISHYGIPTFSCTSSTRTPVAVEVYPLPMRPIVQDVEYCAPYQVTFTITPQGSNIVPLNTKVWSGSTPNSREITEEFVIGAAPPPSFTLTTRNSISGVHTYWVNVQDQNGCNSPRVSFVARPVTPPPMPIVQVNNICDQGSITFTILGSFSNNTQFNLYYWHGQSQFQGSIHTPDNLITIPSLEPGNYWYEIEAINLSAVGCTSARRRVEVRVFQRPAAPLAPASLSRCGSGPITISLSPPVASQVRVYESPTALTPSATYNIDGNNYNIPYNIQTTTILYLEAQDANNCSSISRTPVHVEIKPQPLAPVEISVLNNQFCTPYAPILRVRMDDNAPGVGLKVYEHSTLNNLVTSCFSCSTDARYYYITLPQIFTNTQFYVSAVLGDCESIDRKPVQVSVNISPAPPVVSSPILLCTDNSVTQIPVSLTVQMGTPAGNLVELYTTSHGGNPIAASNAAPYILNFSLDNIGTYTYYVEATDTRTGCKSDRRQVIIKVNKRPSPPSNTGNDSYTLMAYTCGPGQVIFTVVYNDRQNIAIRLYRDRQDIQFHDEDKAGYGNRFLVKSPPTSADTKFYISAYDVQTGCESERIAVEAKVYPQVPEPRVADVTRCGQGEFVFSARVQNHTTGSTMRLYTDGGAILAESQNPSIINPQNPNESIFELRTGIYYQSTKFWIAYEHSNSCSSRRIEVRGIIIPIPEPPTARNIDVCRSGSATITVSVSSSTQKVYLFREAHDLATPIDSTTNPFLFTISPQATTTTFYIASATQKCLSPKTAIEVRIIDNRWQINALGATRCGFGSVTFTIAVNGNGVADKAKLYASAQGGLPLREVNLNNSMPTTATIETPHINTTTTFYITVSNSSCESDSRIPVVAQVLPGPEAPKLLSSQLVSCGPASQVTITIQEMPAGANQLRLYTQAIGGRSQTQLNAPPFEFTLGPISNSTIFYLASAKDDCESVRIPFSVIINTPPSAPTSANVSRCGVGEVVFTVTSQDAANTMRLYDTSNNLLATDTLAPFELPARVTQTQTFYIRAFNSRTNCLGDATAVVATVNPALGLATPHLSKYQLCHPSILTISVHADSPQGTELRLYDSTSPNTIFSRSSTLGLITTPFISQSKTFYLEQYSSITGCSSSSRTPVEVTVHPPISEPIVLTNPITLGCGGGSVVNILAQMGSNRGNEMRLYTTPTGGSFVYSTSTSPYVLRTYPVSTNDMVFYFVAAANSQTGCESERVGVIIRTVSSPPSVPIASNVIICNNNPQVNPVFTASMGNIIGTEIRLYTQSTGGNPIVSATNIPYQLTAPPITTHTTFYIAAAIGNCESQRAEVVATIGRLPNLPTVQNIFRCPSGPVTFTVIPGSGPIPTEAIRMYDSNQNLIKEDNNLSYIFSVNLSTTTTFFFSARNGVCETERVQAVAILDRPTEPSVNNVVRCGSGKVTFSATYQGNVPISEIRLFEQNGTYLGSDSNEPYEIETTVSTTTTFTIIAYARNGNCQSRPVQVVGRVEPPLPAPNISSVVHQCGNNPGIVSVSLPPSAALRVYNSLSSGSPIHSFPEGTNTIRLPEGVYFLASAKEGCESDRVRLIIRSAIVPASPTVNNISYCENTHVSFTAQMGTPAGNRILLYTQELGGTAIATATTGPNYILSPPNPISRIATYYLAVASQDCESPRIPVTATPTPNFLPPTLSSNTIHLCNTNQVSFTVNVGNQAVERVYLYTVASGGLPVSTASTFPYVLTTSVTTSTTLYVESAGSENRCRSIRIPVLVNFDTPEPPIVPSTITNCGPGNVKIEASIQSNRGGNEVRLYPRPVGVGFISSDNTAPFELVVNVTTTTTFYLATARSGTNCESERIPVEIKIVPIPSIPTVVPDNIILCQGGTFTITVNQGPIPGNEVRLYTSENSEDPVEGTTFPPYVITYYVDNTSDFFVATNNNIEGCESPRKKITVQMGPKISTSITAANCQQSGSINVQTNEGSGNFSYSLTNINGNTITSSNVNFNNLRPGSYALTVRDISYNCIINQNIEIQAQVPSPQPWVNNVMGTSATINWNSIPGAESYIVRYRDDNGNFSEITINASNTFVIIPTTPNRNYTVQVRAICASGIDSPFGNVSFQSSSMGTPLHCSQVKRGFCSTPEDLRVEINSPTSATFRWTPNLDGQGSAVCYVIRYGIAGQNNWTLQVVPHPNCELQVTNLIPGQTYEVQIRTNCQNCFTNVGSLTHYSSSVSFTMPYSRQEIENSINSSLGDYLKVYPNPSMGLFYVEFFTPEPTQEGQIKITDAWGKIVLEQTIPIEEGQNQITLNLDNKAAGIYFLELQQGNTKKTARLIKQ